MARRVLFGIAIVAIVGCLPRGAAAQEPEKKTLDAFDRQKLTASYTISKQTGKVTMQIKANTAVYPAGTKILVICRYLQGESSKEFPYGNPDNNKRDGTRKRIADSTVYVKEWAYNARLKFERYLPPGEYIINGVFILASQKRKVRRQFVAEYVPEHERKNPCEFCRQHFGAIKVMLVDPSFQLRSEYAAMEGELWKKQKADYKDRIESLYKDWYTQLVGARETMRQLSYDLTGYGEIELQAIHNEVQKLPEDQQKEMLVFLGLRTVTDSLKRREAWLGEPEQVRQGLPKDPYQYWRRMIFGDGVANEDLTDPLPVRSEDNPNPARPWSYNYVKPRLAIVREEMRRYRSQVEVLINPALFMELNQLTLHLERLVAIADKQMDSAAEMGLRESVIDRLNEADESSRGEIMNEAKEKWETTFQAMFRERAKIQLQIATVMQACDKGLEIDIVFPLATWPVPDSLERDPMNNPEELKQRLQRRFGTFIKEARGSK